MEEFKVKAGGFDGPLDLMLHLIRENKLDLFDLDVNVLTDQYIAYLKGMQEMHLEIVSEYMSELALLIEIKSRKMLPDHRDENTEEEEDPKEKLVQRLLEYQKFKEASEQLNVDFMTRQEYLSRPVSSLADEFAHEEVNVTFHESPYALMKAMQKCLMRMHLTEPKESSYTVSEISIEERELQVEAKLADLPDTFRFEKLLEDVQDTPLFIATFLSVLDLARLQKLLFTVDDNDVIWFRRGLKYE